MSLTIKQYNEKWQIHINEVWQYGDLDTLFKTLRMLADFKDKNGQIGGNKK